MQGRRIGRSSGPHRAREAQGLRGPGPTRSASRCRRPSSCCVGFARPDRDRNGRPRAADLDRDGDAPDLLTALFTATSAVCVTGLVIVDTGTYWSVFGQSRHPRARPARWVRHHDQLDPAAVPHGRPPDEPARPGPRPGVDGDAEPRRRDRDRPPGRGVHPHRGGGRRGRPHVAFLRSTRSPLRAMMSGAVPRHLGVQQRRVRPDGRLPEPRRLRRRLARAAAIGVLFVLGGLGFAIIGDVAAKRRWAPLRPGDEGRRRRLGRAARRRRASCRPARVVQSADTWRAAAGRSRRQRGLQVGHADRAASPSSRPSPARDHAVHRDGPDVHRQRVGLDRRRDQGHNVQRAAHRDPRDGPGRPSARPSAGGSLTRRLPSAGGRAPLGRHRVRLRARSPARRPAAVRSIGVRGRLRARDGRPQHRHHARPVGAGRLLLVAAMFVGRLGPLTLVLALAARARPVSCRPAVETIRIG